MKSMKINHLYLIINIYLLCISYIIYVTLYIYYLYAYVYFPTLFVFLLPPHKVEWFSHIFSTLFKLIPISPPSQHKTLL